MHSNKYCLIEVETTNKNPIYDEIKGSVCYLAYLRQGERGWLLAETKDEFRLAPHRIHTSVVQDIQYNNNKIVLVTQNTRYVFETIQ